MGKPNFASSFLQKLFQGFHAPREEGEDVAGEGSRFVADVVYIIIQTTREVRDAHIGAFDELFGDIAVALVPEDG